MAPLFCDRFNKKQVYCLEFFFFSFSPGAEGQREVKRSFLGTVLQSSCRPPSVAAAQLLIVSYLLPGKMCVFITNTTQSLERRFAALACSSATPNPPRLVTLHLPKCRAHTAAVGVFVFLAVTSHYTPIFQHVQFGVRSRATP